MTATEPLATERLVLDPLRADHADEMVAVLADPALYAFTGGTPPDREALRTRYERQVVGHSADGSETWHNWIVRVRHDDRPIGFVQATIVDDGRTADIAWLIGVAAQGHGFATEAARAVVAWLDGHGARSITANVHPAHDASAAVARRVGLEPTDELRDGERVWRRPTGAAPRHPDETRPNPA